MGGERWAYMSWVPWKTAAKTSLSGLAWVFELEGCSFKEASEVVASAARSTAIPSAQFMKGSSNPRTASVNSPADGHKTSRKS